MVGTTLLHYTVTAELGAGGMGRVYLARDENTRRLVAIKLLDPALAGDEAARARLAHEAAAAARLSHPNIVGLYGLEQDGKALFLVEEYVEGETLAGRLRRGPLGPREALRLGLELASALDHAHRHGVLHRDLKPANVLLAADGTAKIADFGIARTLGGTTLTGEGEVPGTLGYVAPERLRGHRGDARVDLFALGAVLYEALSGRPPFPGEVPAEVVHGVLNEDPRPPEVPSASLLPLAALVMELLAKDPAQRPPDAAAVLETLRCLAAPVQAPLRRERHWLVPALATLAVAVAAVAWWWGRTHGPVAPAPPGSIAVIQFENVEDPADRARMGAVTGNLLVAALAQAPGLDVLGSQRVLEALREVQRSGGAPDRGAALRVARRVQAGRLVTGSILRASPMVITAEVCDVRTGRVLQAERVEGTPGQDVFEVVDALGAALARRMGTAGQRARLEPVAQRSSGNLEAQREYAEGLEQLASGHLVEADSAFSSAVRRDPHFAQAHFQRAMTRWWLYEPQASRAEILRARELAARLSPMERRLLEGVALLVAGQYRSAMPAFEQLARDYPDEKFVLYGLVEARFHGGDLTGTIRAARDLLARDPGFSIAGVHLVDALAEVEGDAAAVAEGERLLDRAPRNMPLYRALADRASARLDLAAIESLHARAESAGVAMPWPSLAIAALERGKGDEAARLWAGGGAEWQKEEARRQMEVWAAMREGRFLAARSLAEANRRFMNAHPRGMNTHPMADLAFTELALGHPQQAIAWMDSVAAMIEWVNPNPQVYRLCLHAMMWSVAPRPAEARRELERAEAVPGLRREERGWLRTSQAYVLAAEGRPRLALDTLRGAIWLGPMMSNGALRLLRADLEHRLGHDAAALAICDSLLPLPLVLPWDRGRLQLYRARALEKLGRPTEAAAATRAFLAAWRNADPGRPEVAEARSLLARVTRPRAVAQRRSGPAS